jgi:pyroglutamyl-peptidase
MSVQPRSPQAHSSHSLPAKVLLTSFDIWKRHHISNASDDLLNEFLNQHGQLANSHLLRKLPVDFQRAPELVIAAIREHAPEWIVCCGMAERRSCLTLESNGKSTTEILQTPANLTALVSGLKVSAISHDAGRFVCNHLYYSVLAHLRQHQLNSQCIFVHVPVLHPNNLAEILADFQVILQRIQNRQY